MKIINLIAVSLFVLIPATSSCQNQKAQQNNETSVAQQPQAQSQSSSPIEHLTTATFKQKVFDYSVNKEWKFAGDKPAIIDFYAD